MYSEMGHDGASVSDDDRDDALSPTDGYFHASGTSVAASSQPFIPGQGHLPQQRHQWTSSNVPVVPNVLVEDPTLQTDESADKAKEAKAELERSMNNGSRRKSSAAYRTHHQSHLDAPTAYSPSPSSPPSGVCFQGYQTFVPPHSGNTNDADDNVDPDSMGLSEEHQALLPRQPQSMGGSINGLPKSRWQRVKNATHSLQMRGKVKTLLGIAVFLSIFFAILGSVSLSSGGRSRHPKGIIDQDPVRQPKMGGQRDLEWRPSDQCRNTPHRFDKTLSDITFDSGYTLSIEQRPGRISHRKGRTPNISGQVLICPSGENSKRGSVEIEIISNDEKLTADIIIAIEDDGKQAIKIITPHVLEWWEYNGEAPCIQMRVTVHVPQNSYIDSLGLDVVHLDVEIAEGLAMGAVDGPIIKTVVGNVNTPLADIIEDDNVFPYSLQSRRIVVQTVSGDVKGWFPLYDLLKVGSASGNVYVEVVPKSADKGSARQAMLSVDSISGNVRIKESLAFAVDDKKSGKKLPARDYVVKVETASGNVHADVAMTSRADFQSTSGDLTLKLLPLLTKGSERGDLHTETMSGTTTVTVLRPLEIQLGADEKTFMTDTEARRTADGPPLSELQTRHGSTSGDIKLLYPSSWTGRFKAESISGGITVKGQDVKITHSSRGIPKRVEGEKGKGNSFAHMGSILGDVELYVGKE
ncbi:hypothetical protein C2857_001999 [Epichloe festucae Fl1]|uniref:DUF4097 domain-containing protein n=1 Tax=Epichloe festucae (strain Fl1) TaxID=877507 RepID=A0A7S9KK47_EPIFF|nr:hypothetical protein C2857_001999 [Epichloe festucae Fl1]